MAVDQDLLDQIAASVADLYREVEASLITVIADELRKGLIAPTAETKLGAVIKLRAAAQAVYDRLQKTKSEKVREAIRTAYRDGHASALTGLPVSKAIRDDARQALAQVPNAAVIENIANALHRDLGRVEGNILRAPVDAYRAVQAATAARIATGTATRRQASQAAWQRLMDQGIASFTDSANRRWRLSSYAEMIGRTNAQRAMMQGQMDRLASVGIDLVYVSDNTQECKVCRPYESKVLRRNAGPVGKIQMEHGTKDGEQVVVDVLDTLDGARDRGFQHPNCRHSVSAYLPGVTKLKANTEDPEGDKARQQQRALERRIRAAKEQQLGALTPEAKKTAGAKVRAAQAVLRDHLAAHPKLKRLPYREQVGAGNIPPAGGPKGGPVGDLHPTPPTPGTPAPDVEAAERQAEEATQTAVRKRKEAAAAEHARLEAEARAQAETEAAEKARAQAEAHARAQAEEEAKRAAEAAEKAQAEAEARAQAARKARAETEAKARADAEEKAKRAAEAAQKAQAEAAERARLEAEEKARLEAEARAEAEAKKVAADRVLARLLDHKDATDPKFLLDRLARGEGTPEERDAWAAAVKQFDRLADAGEKNPTHQAWAAKLPPASDPDALTRARLGRLKDDELRAAALRALQRELEARASRTGGMRSGLRHHTNGEGLKWARSELPMPTDLTDAEKKALRGYTGADYMMVNRGLRGTPPTNPTDRVRYDQLLTDLDTAFTKSRLPESVIVHRGVDNEYVKFLGASVNKPEKMAELVGKIFPEHGYMSTSVGQNPAFPGEAYLMIRVPAGHEVMNVMPISEYGEDEREVVLNRGTKYVVHAAYKVGRAWHIEVEVVPEGWVKPPGWGPDVYGDADKGFKDGMPK